MTGGHRQQVAGRASISPVDELVLQTSECEVGPLGLALWNAPAWTHTHTHGPCADVVHTYSTHVHMRYTQAHEVLAACLHACGEQALQWLWTVVSPSGASIQLH